MEALTADTITDKQIRDGHEAGVLSRYDYTHAVKYRNSTVRARCAEILNARRVSEGK